MKALDVDNGMEKNVPFQRKDAWRVPKSAGCYVITNAYRDVLYIGETNNLRRRMGEHLDDGRITKPTPIGRAVWFHYKLIAAIDTKDAEDRLLMRYTTIIGRLPVLNRAGP